MKKKMSSFFKTYIAVMASLVALLIVAAVILWTVLDAYEVTRPKHVAEEVFNKYFVSADIAGLLSATGSSREKLESDEVINSASKELLNTDSLKFFEVSSDETSSKYAVTEDNNRIAYFTVTKTGEKGKYGFKYYKLSDAELFFAPYGNVTVRVPEGYSLVANDVSVGDSYITERGIESDSCKYMPEGVEGIKYTEYKLSGLFSEPSLKVLSADGREVDVNLDTVNNVYVAGLAYDSALEEEMKDYIIKAASAYTAYMSNDARFSAVSKYLDSSSEVYERVRKSEVYWVRDHNGYKISNEKAFEFYKYAEGVFSCRVTLKETLTRPGYANHTENIDVIFYCRTVDGKTLIYDIVTNS